MKEGWQCPACKTIYAPHVEKCECIKKENSTDITLTFPDAIVTTALDSKTYIAPYNPDLRIRYDPPEPCNSKTLTCNGAAVIWGDYQFNIDGGSFELAPTLFDHQKE